MLQCLTSNKGAVGYHLKTLLMNISTDYDKAQAFYDILDARGIEWNTNNKVRIIELFERYLIPLKLPFNQRTASVLLKKAISNAQKSLIS